MVSGAINYVFQGMISDHVRIVDEDGPKVYRHEEGKVQMPLNREDEYEEVVGHRLSIAVYRMESMRSVGCRDNPFVMRFVDIFVEER